MYKILIDTIFTINDSLALLKGDQKDFNKLYLLIIGKFIHFNKTFQLTVLFKFIYLLNQ